MNADCLKKVFYVVCFISWVSSFLPVHIAIKIYYAKTDFTDISFLTGESWLPRNCSRLIQNVTEEKFVIEDSEPRGAKLSEELAEKKSLDKCLENLRISKGDRVMLTTLIIVGGLILISSLAGICGGIHKSRDTMSVNIFLHGISILIIICITFGLLYDILSKYNDANLKFRSLERFHELMSPARSEVDLIRKYYSASLSAFQKQESCCGIFSPQDYFFLNQSLSEDNPITCQCCHSKQGCWLVIEDARRHNNWVIFAMLFSCCLILVAASIVGLMLMQYLQEFST